MLLFVHVLAGFGNKDPSKHARDRRSFRLRTLALRDARAKAEGAALCAVRVKRTNTLEPREVSRGRQCLLPSSRERRQNRRCPSGQVLPG